MSPKRGNARSAANRLDKIDLTYGADGGHIFPKERMRSPHRVAKARLLNVVRATIFKVLIDYTSKKVIF